MRITGGRARGISLKAPRGERTRPATDAMRQALFSSLGPLFEWDELRFLDLFAGTGSYGLEAWSRGAKTGIFVEKDRSALQCLQGNILSVAHSLELQARQLRIAKQDVLKWTAPEGMRFELIFCDPPYEIIDTIAERLFACAKDWLAETPEATMVFEAPGDWENIPDGWQVYRRLGKSGHGPSIRFLRRA